MKKNVLEEAVRVLKLVSRKNSCYDGAISFDVENELYYFKDFTEDEWKVIKEEVNKGKTKYEVIHTVYSSEVGEPSADEVKYKLRRIK